MAREDDILQAVSDYKEAHESLLFLRQELKKLESERDLLTNRIQDLKLRVEQQQLTVAEQKLRTALER